ncbi:MAG: hypothetical protein IKE89_00130 [Bacilli bacterium]|nr:hypothetical protein [Bacilli bacterium]
MRRMDRYNNNTTSATRRDRNEELYRELNSDIKYANVTDVTNTNAYEITNKKNRTREDYHKLKEYNMIKEEPREKKELQEFNYINKTKENKVYDINTIIEETKKNRQKKEELEEKKKYLKDTYNILSKDNKAELEKYRKEKEERIKAPNESEIREIIDTIASKTLAGDISKETSVNLLSDLMATQALDRVAAQASEKENNLEETVSKYKVELEEEKPNTEKLSAKDIKKVREKANDIKEVSIMDKADDSFYTRSMDLSDKDFSLSDEFVEKSMPLGIKILIALVIIVIIAVAVVYAYMTYFK